MQNFSKYGTFKFKDFQGPYEPCNSICRMAATHTQYMTLQTWCTAHLIQGM